MKHSIYPTSASLEEAEFFIKERLPIKTINEFYALMKMYENTYFYVLRKVESNDKPIF